jgi:hypothetical protein
VGIGIGPLAGGGRVTVRVGGTISLGLAAWLQNGDVDGDGDGDGVVTWDTCTRMLC